MRHLAVILYLLNWVGALLVYPLIMMFLVPYTAAGLICALFMRDTVKAMATYEYRERLWGIASEEDYRRIEDSMTNNVEGFSVALFFPVLFLCGIIGSFMLEDR